jgi:hypothetical protein
LLRWYSAVIPMAMGALGGLTALLGKALRARQHAQWVRLDGASQRDLAFWRWLLGVGLQRPTVWSAPFWFLAGRLHDRVTHELFTDASTLIDRRRLCPGKSIVRTVSMGGRRETSLRIRSSRVDRHQCVRVCGGSASYYQRERVLERDRGFVTSK